MEIEVTINGREHRLEVDPKARLVDFLRVHLYLTGCKEGCGIGECGACVVLLDGEAVASCLILAPQAHRREILTIEGLAGPNGELHPLQEAFVEKGAIQCGFCSPGMVLSSLALLRKNPDPTREEVREAISGNLCRCTGYAQIIEAVLLGAERLRERMIT